MEMLKRFTWILLLTKFQLSTSTSWRKGCLSVIPKAILPFITRPMEPKWRHSPDIADKLLIYWQLNTQSQRQTFLSAMDWTMKLESVDKLKNLLRSSEPFIWEKKLKLHAWSFALKIKLSWYRLMPAIYLSLISKQEKISEIIAKKERNLPQSLEFPKKLSYQLPWMVTWP